MTTDLIDFISKVKIKVPYQCEAIPMKLHVGIEKLYDLLEKGESVFAEFTRQQFCTGSAYVYALYKLIRDPLMCVYINNPDPMLPTDKVMYFLYDIYSGLQGTDYNTKDWSDIRDRIFICHDKFFKDCDFNEEEKLQHRLMIYDGYGWRKSKQIYLNENVQTIVTSSRIEVFYTMKRFQHFKYISYNADELNISEEQKNLLKLSLCNNIQSYNKEVMLSHEEMICNNEDFAKWYYSHRNK